MKKTIILAIFILLSTSVLAAVDDNIQYEKVNATYVGNGIYNIQNADFVDVKPYFWAKDEITKLSALGIFRGYFDGNERTFAPDGEVTKEQAIALIIRLIGKNAQAAAYSETSNLEGVGSSWSDGYLKVASDIGLITKEQYEHTILDETQIANLPADTKLYKKGDKASRQEIAVMICKAVSSINKDKLAPIYEYRNIFNVSDYDEADVAALPYIEALMRANIMVGDGAKFNPKSAIKRSEMAKVIVNMEDTLYSTMTLQQKSGVVAVRRNKYDKGSKISSSILKVRNNYGGVDELAKTVKVGIDGVEIVGDCVVLYDGQVTGLDALKDGDKIKYIVDNLSKKVIYVNKIGEEQNKKIVGALQGGIDLEKGLITIKDVEKGVYTYTMRKSLYDKEQNIVVLSDKEVKKEDMPYTNLVTLTVQDGVVVRVDYDGAEPMYEEISGTIKDVNSKFKYITIDDINGNEVTKSLDGADIAIEKVDYFIDENKVGHIDEIFDEKKYDRTDSLISDLEVGDIVHIRLKEGKILSVSAKSSNIQKIGTIKDVKVDGEKADVVLDDGSLVKLEVAKGTDVEIDHKKADIYDLRIGQMVDITINDAVIDAGRLKNIVKKVEVITSENKVKNIYKSKVGVYNDSQNTVSLVNAYTLVGSGFKQYDGVVLASIDDESEIIYDGKKVSKDFMKQNLVGSNINVYTATTDYYGKSKVAKMIFDDSVPKVLKRDTVADKKINSVMLASSRKNIALNSNAIVVKDGYLANAPAIKSGDKVQVVVGSTGVVFNVLNTTDENMLKVYRGRIKNIDDYESVKMSSIARLDGFEYKFSPISRVFTIDETTKIIEDGKVKLADFVTYGDKSKYDEVYTVVADGDFAKMLVKNKYAKEGVLGEVVSVNGKDIEIKYAKSYESDSKTISFIDLNNSAAKLITDDKTIFIKNGELVDIEDLERGDKLQCMSEKSLRTLFITENKRDIEVSIVFVK